MTPHILIVMALVGAPLNASFERIRHPWEHSALAVVAERNDHNPAEHTLVASREDHQRARIRITPSDFSAWIDKMPGAGSKLIVEGAVTVPSGGWSVRLTPASRYAADADVLTLKLTAEPPRRKVTRGVVTIPLRYEKNRASAVLIQIVLENGESFTLPIAEVF
jgi:hypothetical protein